MVSSSCWTSESLTALPRTACLLCAAEVSSCRVSQDSCAAIDPAEPLGACAKSHYGAMRSHHFLVVLGYSTFSLK